MTSEKEMYPLPFNAEFHREVGGLFISGFEGTKASGDIASAMKGGLGGVILFPRNLGKPKEILKLTDGLRKAAGNDPIFVGIDQEGGRVARLKAPFTEFPPMSKVGEKKDPELARRVGEVIATELAAVGINLDFAPVVDIDEPRKDLVIGDRSFSSDASLTAELAAAFIDGMQSVGVAACAKHFPGHGATDRDSHLELPEIKLSRDELERHLIPFKKAIERGVASIMTAHIRLHALDKVHPATLSWAILTESLRMKLGFNGLIISDDIAMKGVASLMPPEDIALLSLRSGADIIMTANDLPLAGKLRQVVHDAVRYLIINPDDILDKIERVKTIRSRFAPKKSRPSLDVIGCKAHLEVARRAAE